MTHRVGHRVLRALWRVLRSAYHGLACAGLAVWPSVLGDTSLVDFMHRRDGRPAEPHQTEPPGSAGDPTGHLTGHPGDLSRDRAKDRSTGTSTSTDLSTGLSTGLSTDWREDRSPDRSKDLTEAQERWLREELDQLGN